MNQYPVAKDATLNIWVRGIFMLLMGFIYHLTGTLLAVIAVVQFAIALLNGSPNARLRAFGENLGRYARQIVCFLTFSADRIPFPFSDWPSAD